MRPPGVRHRGRRRAREARPARRRQCRHARLCPPACWRPRAMWSTRPPTARPRWRRRGATTPDLVLTDVMMPKLDGFGLLQRAPRGRRARRHPRDPAVRPGRRRGEGRGPRGRRRRLSGQAVRCARAAGSGATANIQMAEIRREADRAVFQSEQRLPDDPGPPDRWRLSTGRVAVFEWDGRQRQARASQGPLARSSASTRQDAEARPAPGDRSLQASTPDDRDA